MSGATRSVTVVGLSGAPVLDANAAGNVAIGKASGIGTARLELPAGTATATTAPLKLNNGTLLTTPEAGAVEMNSGKLYFTPSATREQVFTGLTSTATLDFPSIAGGTAAELTVSVTGAATGETVLLGPPAALETGLGATGIVTASNTVTVRLANNTAGAVDPASATWRATVLR